VTKHIHIYIHRAPARDAGFDESKHKRDHGKFSSTGGGGTVESHSAASAKHAENAKSDPNAANAASAHAVAARGLGLAQKAHAAGNTARAEEMHAHASHYANVAAAHEAGHKGQAEAPPKALTNKNMLAHLGASHVGSGLGAGTAIISGISKTHNIPALVDALNAQGRQVAAVKGSGGTTELWVEKSGEKFGAHMKADKASVLKAFGIGS
jgi:hypothetical protein